MQNRIFLDIDGRQADFDRLRARYGRGGDLPGVRGVKVCGDVVRAGLATILHSIPSQFERFVDTKIHGTPNDVARRVADYVCLRARAPHYLTVDASGDGACGRIKAATATAGSIKIVAVPLLSTTTPEECAAQYGKHVELVYAHNAIAALAAGAPALTCPAWLLPVLRQELTQQRKPLVIATGVHSAGLSRSGHYRPMPPEWALCMGADAVVMGSEILDAAQPLEALMEICDRIRPSGAGVAARA